MNIRVKGIVLCSHAIGDNDRLCTLLTDEIGLINAWARGAQNSKNKNFAATAQFAYGEFVIFENKGNYHIDESVSEDLFMQLRNDIEKLALGQYLCELAAELAPIECAAITYLLLMRMALYLLSRDLRSPRLIKAATELRMLSMSGYQPNMLMCSGCGAFEPQQSLLTICSGELRCADCGDNGELSAPLSIGAMTAMRHIIYSDLRRVYSFDLGSESLEQLSEAVEEYTLYRLDRTFTTLEFYKSL